LQNHVGFWLQLTSGLSPAQWRGYEGRKKKLRQERDYYTALMERANIQINDACWQNAKSIIELATLAKSLWLTRSRLEKKEFLEKILSNPVLDGTTVRYALRNEMGVLALIKQTEEWRPQGDSNPCIHRERVVSWASRRWGQDEHNEPSSKRNSFWIEKVSPDGFEPSTRTLKVYCSTN
jgi:hypothetical protein